MELYQPITNILVDSNDLPPILELKYNIYPIYRNFLVEPTTNISVIGNDLPPILELRYNYEPIIDTIDEEFIKNTRAEFGEKYGPVNSIVLSRSGESDNVYLRDEDSVTQNGLCEIKIVDNQIMNDNTRDRFLPGILARLDGLEYYPCDYESIGITYLDLCDKYNIKVRDNIYPTIMLNDEVEVSSGLNEIIYTEQPQQTETDYKKADKTDRRINQTNLIVDKQAQTIDAIIGTDTENFSSLTELKLETDEVTSKVESNYNFEREETSNNLITPSEDMQVDGLIELKITGNAISSDYLVLHITNNEQEYVTLPVTTILQSGDTKDELSIRKIYNDETKNYEYHTYLTQRLDRINGITQARTSSTNFLLAETTDAIRTEASEDILLEDYVEGEQDLGVLDLIIDSGSHTFSIQDFNGLDYYLKYAILNDVVVGFATKAHIISEINQTPESITISADKISLEGKTIDLTSDTINIDSTNFKVDTDGKITATAGDIGGFNMDSTKFYKNVGGNYDYSVYDLYLVQSYILGKYSPSGSIFNILDINNNGEINLQDMLFIQNKILGTGTQLDKYVNGYVEINSSNPKNCLSVYSGNEAIVKVGVSGIESETISAKYLQLGTGAIGAEGVTIKASGTTGEITCVSLSQTSLAEIKKNFEKLENALDIVNDTDIYKYNLKEEYDKDKKHIGFVIGDKFNYREEITSNRNDGVDIYSMVSVLWKAVQEQQEQIEDLKNQINILKGGN